MILKNRKGTQAQDGQFSLPVNQPPYSASPEPKPMPCLAENNAWIACYKENANVLIIKCAPLAQNFADSCARRVRQLANSADK
ncbi:hypothetical protein PTKIN_Ptkin14bG0186500 [Pterospermum kingtungense]